MTQAQSVAIESSQINSSGVLQVAGGGTGTTTSTGTGSVVLSTSPTLVTPTINQINTSVTNTSLGAGNASIMKNRIINGAMVIDQRNNGASVTPTPTGTFNYTIDRWAVEISQASKISIQQNAGSITPPAGFSNYLGITSLATTSVGASDYFILRQGIEGYNIADLGWGTANAKTVTLSFQVYSSLTGTFGASLTNSSQNYSYPFTYSIPVANTWTQISVTIAGPTGGSWNITNGAGIGVQFGLGVGSTYSGTAGAWAGAVYLSATGAISVVGTSGATFYITGVQLEVGSSATGFEYRQYGQELALCQRYLQVLSNATASSIVGVSGASNIYSVPLITPLRSTPSFSGNLSVQQYYYASAGAAQSNQALAYASLGFGGGVNQFRTLTPNAGAAGLGTWLDCNTGQLNISAEL